MRRCGSPAVVPRVVATGGVGTTPAAARERDREGGRQRDVSRVAREDEVYSCGWKRLRLAERGGGDLEAGRAGRGRRRGERSRERWRLPGKSRRGQDEVGGSLGGATVEVAVAPRCSRWPGFASKGCRRGVSVMGSGVGLSRVEEVSRAGAGVAGGHGAAAASSTSGFAGFGGADIFCSICDMRSRMSWRAGSRRRSRAR